MGHLFFIGARDTHRARGIQFLWIECCCVLWFIWWGFAFRTLSWWRQWRLFWKMQTYKRQPPSLSVCRSMPSTQGWIWPNGKITLYPALKLSLPPCNIGCMFCTQFLFNTYTASQTCLNTLLTKHKITDFNYFFLYHNIIIFSKIAANQENTLILFEFTSPLIHIFFQSYKNNVI